ncbi:MAG: RNA polymerase sporulation sigma factor SigE [Clostridia bacterium]
MDLFFLRRLKLLIERLCNKVFYINGSAPLPAPMTQEEERECINAYNNGDMNARAKLVERNLRLVVYIAKKFDNTGVLVEDLISIGTIGLIKAVNSFKSDKNIKLATYASRCIENEILMHLRKSNIIRSEVSIDEPLNVDWDGNELLLSDILGSDPDSVHKDLEAEVEKQLLLGALKKLSKRESEIMVLRFGFLNGKEYTQKEVADILNISQSYISRLEKKILVKLKIVLEKTS